MKPLLILFLGFFSTIHLLAQAAEWKPAKAPLDTPWTQKVDPSNPLPEHPRPDFHRSNWKSLNGLWDYALEPVDFEPMQGFIDRPSMTSGTPPSQYDGKILVPFAIDAPLSGVMHVLRPQERLWYERTFEVPSDWEGNRVLLHFEASDWETSVYVNGHRSGQHRGGYDPFSFDITNQLKDGTNRLIVCVWDGTEQHCQPLGKQIMPENRQGFRYQPTGGIWQSVWLEAVPKTYLKDFKLVPDLKGFDISARLSEEADNSELRIKIPGQKTVSLKARRNGQINGHVPISNPRHWSPDSPYLYDLQLELVKDGEVIDTVNTYAGLRTIERKSSGKLLLNGQEAPFQFGPLDQGYWPDGILTPPHEDAIKFDLEYLKSIGCNMVRVHIKVHPRRWYYHADRLGLLVWQDMICTPKYGQTVDAAGSANWRREFSEIVEDFGNHPSIVNWIVFNEAWGQHDIASHTDWISDKDPSRVIISASGWTDHGTGDIQDIHNYTFYPSAPVEDAFGGNRTLMFGELGGHNLLLQGKKWYPDQTQNVGPPLDRARGRMNFNSLQDLAVKYPFYLRNARHFVSRYNYRGFVYTQISDIEHECNGWLSYDRRVSKLPAETYRKIHQSLSQPIEYNLLSDNKGWLAKRVKSTGKEEEPQTPNWVKKKAPRAGFSTFQIPHTKGPLVSASNQSSAFGIIQELKIKETPQRAVLEIRAAHKNAWGEPAPPRLDGHRRRIPQVVQLLTFLDGALHRRSQVSVERGQGEGVLFLEFTDDELQTLRPGSHTLAIEIQNPSDTIQFDAKLWSYRD